VGLPRTLLVTNDFPPRVGGIQRTLHALWRELPADRVSVFAPASEGSPRFDGGEPYVIRRGDRGFLWPTTRTRDAILAAAGEVEAEVVLFGAAYPLALLGPALSRAGLRYVTAAHGFEYWLSLAPGTHALMRRATSRACHVAVMCSAFIARVVRTAVPERVPVSVMYPGADVEAFRPDLPTEDLRRVHGLGARPVVVCVSRLVPRKGQDVLIRAMPQIRQRVRDAALLVVGDGPHRARLERLAEEHAPRSVVFAGQVSEADLPRYYAAGDVFAMPCRTRLGGLEVEGWGNVFIEAAACGRPVVVGDSGGARESLVDGTTGVLVDGTRVAEVADAVGALLADPGLARRMGEAGRRRVERSYTWPRAAAQLSGWLAAAAG
jgi:phosphatidylinositol alpha-1,6-mannosyltransferase